MKIVFVFNTSAGEFTIVEHDGRFHPYFDGQDLGSYETARQAAAELAAGNTFIPSPGIDPASLGIPDDLRAWKAVGLLV
ncbi:MAG TPA: hypothetical protein VEH04_11270 [Verrucomicrobiae bacterium]|nr:hypothetical protein [Verrucomicrobiae bacterium]